MRRDWTDARTKVDAEGCCRVCAHWPIEAAHVIGRARDKRTRGVAYVDPLSVVPLCRPHHTDYDSHRLDLLPYLTLEEQVQAVRDAGGLEAARRRIVGSDAYRKEAA